MDYDDDGILDFVSGSYDPGDIYLVRGLGGGEYAKTTGLFDRGGTALVHHPKELQEYERLKDDPDADEDESIQARVASFGSWPAMVDWDGDGDLDLLIGTFLGEVFLRENEGSRAAPSFSEEVTPIDAGGERLRVQWHANPVAADWDGDGRFDLVVSASDGSVRWYRNVGTETAPEFAEGQMLVERKSTGKFLTQYVEPGDSVAPGVRAQICVTDYDGDGRLDLLLGDYSSVAALRDLDEQERSEFDELLRRERALEERIAGLAPESKEMREVQQELSSISTARKPYLDDSVERRTSSYVWLYLRQPPPLR